jgi:heme exporter protein CcmD
VSYVVAAYAVTIGALFAYALSLAASARRLREEIAREESNRG